MSKRRGTTTEDIIGKHHTIKPDEDGNVIPQEATPPPVPQPDVETRCDVNRDVPCEANPNEHSEERVVQRNSNANSNKNEVRKEPKVIGPEHSDSIESRSPPGTAGRIAPLCDQEPTRH